MELNTDSFLTGFPKTPLICHWLEKKKQPELTPLVELLLLWSGWLG